MSIIIPKKYCKNSQAEFRTSCEPTDEYKFATQGHVIWNIMNQQRLLQNEYKSGSPIEDYMQIEWQYIPMRSENWEYTIKRSIIDHEDNLFMALNGVTNVEE